VNPEERARILAAAHRTADNLPELSPDCCRHIAELLREPINRYVTEQRRAQRDGAA
jgi:hypothetical protein